MNNYSDNREFSLNPFRGFDDESEALFNANAPFWHLCTPGDAVEIIFTNDDEFRHGVTILAICLLEFPGLKIYSFQLMNNHIHIILSGPEDDCYSLFERFKRRLLIYLSNSGRTVDMSGFKAKALSINDLKALRSEIIYTHRNGYVVHPEDTPYSYRWGSNLYYFSAARDYFRFEPYLSLTYRAKRDLTSSRVVEFPDDYLVCDGMISPVSFCSISEGERYFKSGHQYFSLLSKNFEAYSQVAKTLGDKVFMTDDELYSAAKLECKKRYSAGNPLELSGDAKIELARILHNGYNASNRQLKSILKLPPAVLNELFPLG